VTAGVSYAPSPICAKIIDDGSRASLVGLGSADVVYETAESDSGTQLAALFQSRVPDRIGALSAAGMPDLWILPQYHAALFSTGATESVAASIKRAGLIDMSMGSAAGDSAYTDDRPSAGAKGEYVIGPRATEQMLALGSTITSQSVRLRYSDTAETTGSPTASVSIPFSENQVASWTWDPKTARYLRSRADHSQRDAGSGERITASNVVVMWAKYSSLDADIAGSGGHEVVLGGSGQVTVFRDGQRIDGRWRADGESPPTFSTESGQAIRLAPGTTWFEVIPLSANITMR
jgi:hypothetical protein